MAGTSIYEHLLNKQEPIPSQTKKNLKSKRRSAVSLSDRSHASINNKLGLKTKNQSPSDSNNPLNRNLRSKKGSLKSLNSANKVLANMTKKKTKKKTYKGILDTAQRLKSKRNTLQPLNSQDTQTQENSNTNSDAIKFNLKKFNQLICEDIARTKERLSSRQGRTSASISEQGTPMNKSRYSKLISI